MAVEGVRDDVEIQLTPHPVDHRHDVPASGPAHRAVDKIILHIDDEEAADGMESAPEPRVPRHLKLVSGDRAIVIDVESLQHGRKVLIAQLHRRLALPKHVVQHLLELIHVDASGPIAIVCVQEV